MSPLNLALLITFGGLMIVCVFLLFSAGRLALAEFRAKDREPVRQNRFLILTSAMALSALGLMGVSLVRVRDGLNGHELGGTDPMLLSVSLVLLWAAKTAFHWAASLGRRRTMWRLYVALLLVWVAGAILLL